MAERALEALPIPRNRVNYPWPEWMDGSTWLLEHGVDFFADVRSFRNRLHAKATDVGMRVTVNVITLPERALREAKARLDKTGHGLDADASSAAVYAAIEKSYPGGWAGVLIELAIDVPALRLVLEQDAEDWRIVVRARFYDAGAEATAA